MAFRSSRKCPEAGRPAGASAVLAAAFAAAMLAPAAAGFAQSLPESLSDLRVSTAVRLALAADPQTTAVDARVRARAGEVVIDAVWPTDVQARAAAVAAGVAGVVSVAMGDSPPQPVAGLGEGVAVEPDEPRSEQPAEEPAPVPLPVVEPRPTRESDVVIAPAEPAEVGNAGEVRHTVRLGDTLYSIARRYDTSVEELQRLNGLGSSTSIMLGSTLLVRR